MNDLAYHDQSADELRLTLCTGSLDLNQFTILRQDCMQTAIGTINAGIIGVSHFLCFDFGGGQKLYEVFACADINSPQKRASCGPLREVMGAVDLAFFGNIGYRFHFEKLALPSAISEMERIESEAQTKNRGLGMVCELPSLGDPKSISPKTIVKVSEFSSHEMRVKTVHVYPNDQTLVITNTIITRKSKKIKRIR